MEQPEKTRSAASEALIALRHAMGKTQQTFAVEVLKTAIGTIARYETNDPPRGEVLLRLKDIAHEQGVNHLAATFDALWIEETAKTGGQVTFFPASGSEPARGHVITLLVGHEAIKGAQAFLAILTQLGSANPKFRQNAVSALSSLERAARRFDDPKIHGFGDVFVAGLTGAPSPSMKTAKRSRPAGKPRRRKATIP
jgi:hypothetical protein